MGQPIHADNEYIPAQIDSNLAEAGSQLWRWLDDNGYLKDEAIVSWMVEAA